MASSEVVALPRHERDHTLRPSAISPSSIAGPSGEHVAPGDVLSGLTLDLCGSGMCLVRASEFLQWVVPVRAAAVRLHDDLEAETETWRNTDCVREQILSVARQIRSATTALCEIAATCILRLTLAWTA